jgi:hypothetical protein
MGLQFVKPDNRTANLYSLTDKETSVLSDVFQLFDERFDGYFDLYGDTRLYENHIEQLILICSANKYKNNPTISAFKNFLLSVSGQIIVVGD